MIRLVLAPCGEEDALCLQSTDGGVASIGGMKNVLVVSVKPPDYDTVRSANIKEVSQRVGDFGLEFDLDEIYAQPVALHRAPSI